jgi:GNAT superfamily N-acetyltransferase
MRPELSIRVFDSSDLPFAMRLRDAEGWNQTPEFLSALLAHQPDGCFIAEWNGASAGTVTTTIHEGRLGWIGMMLVDANHRRLGIATALLNRAVEFLQASRVNCIALDATPAGREVYQRCGFRDAWGLQRWERDAEVSRGNAVTNRDPIQIPTFDREAFGVDRSLWLQRLASTAEVSMRDGAFAMLRPGVRANYLGPAVAITPSAAADAISSLIGNITTRTFWDIPDANEQARRLAESLGFRPIRSLIRMTHGESPLPGRPELQYAIADPATG